ncbi:Sugar and other transporter [Aspergillus sp. HF37]|nr:Sugar and other transporter [Aspergillus sp. HF37]
MNKRLGRVRAIFLVVMCCIGSFMFSYDTGVVGGVLTMESFQDSYHITKENKTQVSSNATSLLQAGAFFSCFFVWPFTARYGRRRSLGLASVIFTIGGIIQVAPTGHIGAFYAARVIAGVGVGMATVMVPIYSAEMALKEIRGQLGSLFQFFFTVGVMTSYWVDYGVTKHISDKLPKQWQIPIGLQLVPAVILGVGMLFLKESTRWLAKRGRTDEALESLIWIRGGDSEEVRAEMAEILAAIEAERLATQGVAWNELLLPANRYRVFIIITLQIGVQLTGNTSLAYYNPQVFAQIGAKEKNMLLSGFFGVAKVVACLIFVVFLVERIGRRWALVIGAAGMGSFMLIVAVLNKVYPPVESPGSISSPAIATIIMIYMEAATYNMSWGPVSWLYQGEIWPARLREMGNAIGTATQWLFNFILTRITPPALENIGWRTFLMFCIFNYALSLYAFFLIKETTGKSLEDMEHVFKSEATTTHMDAMLAEKGEEREQTRVEEVAK